MFGCWALPINYEEYLKKEEETDAILRGFGEEEWEEDEEFEPMEEAYIVELNLEAYDVEYNGYYVVLIGESYFDVDKLCDVVCGFDESYQEWCELRKKDAKALTKDEALTLFALTQKYSVIEAEDLGEEFETLMSGEEVSCGRIVKQIF